MKCSKNTKKTVVIEGTIWQQLQSIVIIIVNDQKKKTKKKLQV